MMPPHKVVVFEFPKVKPLPPHKQRLRRLQRKEDLTCMLVILTFLLFLYSAAFPSSLLTFLTFCGLVGCFFSNH